MNFHFTHLALENWRNFRKVDVALRDRLFVVGPNASGKTNFLDALRFLRDIARPGGSLADAVQSRGGITHLRSLHARQSNDVCIAVRLRMAKHEWSYEIRITGKKDRAPQLVSERILCDDDVLLQRPNNDDRSDSRQLEQTHLEQLAQNQAFRQLVDAFAMIQTVHVVPQVVKNLPRRANAVLRDAPGSDFIEQLAELSERKRDGILRKIEKLLRRAVPQFKSLRIEREKKSGVPHLEANYTHWRPQGGWHNEQEFSDGTLRLIGLLWSLLQGEGPLILEEPELSLHEAVVQQIPSMLARAATIKRRQIFVSTHANMLMAEGVDASEVLILTPTEEETTATLASTDKAIVAGCKAGLPVGMLVAGRTRPAGIEQLRLPLDAAAE